MIANKKYEFTGETKEVDGVTVHRIRALRDVGYLATMGVEGGWIESEVNLARNGGAWVHRDAVVMGRSTVIDDAIVSGAAVVSGRVVVSERARVSGQAIVSDRAHIADGAHVSGSARVLEDAMLRDEARVSDRAVVRGVAQMYGRSHVEGDALMAGNAELRDGVIGEDATVMGRGQVIVISGFFLETVTIYRAAGLTAGHVVVAGCQTFSLTAGGSAVATLEELAKRHEWYLPPGWKSLRSGLLVAVRGWQKLEAPQGAGATGDGETGTQSLQVGA